MTTPRRFVQAAARRGLGRAYPPALARWRGVQRAWRERRVAVITRDFVSWHGLTVSGGPFAGLVYPDLTATFLVPKLLGIYERELHRAVEAAIRARPEVIVNVGAADGYYAVGLARRCPSAAVRAFEADPGQADLCRRVAAANGVDVRVEGAARPENLPWASLLVIDCEGCERAVLDPDAVPWLRTATIIAELHDPGDSVTRRFDDSHEIELIPTGPQPPARGSAVRLALSEYRPGPMRWAAMTPAREP